MTLALTEFILEDVRCFRGEQRGRIAPITLLVGENSTGKTTFLSAYSILHQLSHFHPKGTLEPNFNQAQFALGSFREIVSSRNDSNQSLDKFKIGADISNPNQRDVPLYRLTNTFSERNFHPIVSSIEFQFDQNSFLKFKRSDTDRIILAIPNYEIVSDYDFDSVYLLLNTLVFSETRKDFIFENSVEISPIVKFLEEFSENLMIEYFSPPHNWEPWNSSVGTLEATSPIRSKPKRTYDPVRETASAEGAHIPMLLNKLYRTDKSNWQSLRNRLVEFGNQSGLFSDISVKQYGREICDPFQLQVKANSKTFANIMDVGYGVSRSLPILVNVLEAERRGFQRENETTFLMQQPEVNLHPRAQAELASFFVDSCHKTKNRFLIETHSDFIIDRFRVCVRNGKLQANDLSILFFEANDTGVKIHSITVDEHGNIENAPPGYRSFFISEVDRVLGFED